MFATPLERVPPISVISSEFLPFLSSRASCFLFCHLERAERVERSPEARSDDELSEALGTRRGFLDSVVGLPRSE